LQRARQSLSDFFGDRRERRVADPLHRRARIDRCQRMRYLRKSTPSFCFSVAAMSMSVNTPKPSALSAAIVLATAASKSSATERER